MVFTDDTGLVEVVDDFSDKVFVFQVGQGLFFVLVGELVSWGMLAWVEIFEAVVFQLFDEVVKGMGYVGEFEWPFVAYFTYETLGCVRYTGRLWFSRAD